jgi:hypothetical protein
VWSKANECRLVSASLGEGQVLSMHSISSASSPLKDDHWVLALTTRALHLMRLCHGRVDKKGTTGRDHHQPPLRRVHAGTHARTRAFTSLFTSWMDPRQQ